jgi:hypothetical protein
LAAASRALSFLSLSGLAALADFAFGALAAFAGAVVGSDAALSAGGFSGAAAGTGLRSASLVAFHWFGFFYFDFVADMVNLLMRRASRTSRLAHGQSVTSHAGRHQALNRWIFPGFRNSWDNRIGGTAREEFPRRAFWRRRGDTPWHTVEGKTPTMR